MKTWIHFIGKKYYPTIAKFEAEARTYGITRRVSLKTMERMAFGDRVLLAMKDGKSALIFGEFIITTVSGLLPPTAHNLGLKVTNQGGAKVVRGCGSYVTGSTYSLDPNLHLDQLAAILQGHADPGKPMVGGRYLPHIPTRMRNLPFAQGFREFDYERWQADVSSKTLPVPRLGLKSLYYANLHGQDEADQSTKVEPQPAPDNDFVIMGSAVQAVVGYSKK